MSKKWVKWVTMPLAASLLLAGCESSINQQVEGTMLVQHCQPQPAAASPQLGLQTEQSRGFCLLQR